MIRWLFRLAGALLTARIAAKGSGRRLGGHVARKQAHKTLSKWLR